MLRQAKAERARYAVEGFVIHVLIDKGSTIQLKAELSFEDEQSFFAGAWSFFAGLVRQKKFLVDQKISSGSLQA